jgi:hypothetical protein
VWWPEDLEKDEPTSETGLTPFRYQGSENEWWTSDDCRECSDLGYTYPDLDISDPKALVRDIARRYNWSRQGFFDRETGPQIPEDMEPPEVNGAFPFARKGAAVPEDLSPEPAEPEEGEEEEPEEEIVEKPVKKPRDKTKKKKSSKSQKPLNGKNPTGKKGTTNGAESEPEEEVEIPEGATVIRSWYVDVEANRNALKGTFTVYYFLGPFDENPHTYARQPSFFGKAHFFIAPPSICDNCMQQGAAGAKVANTTTLTPILHDYIHKGEGDLALESLEPEDVKPFLVKNLRWRVIKVPGPDDEDDEIRPVPSASIEGFQVHVNSDTSYLEEGEFLPVEAGEEDYDDVVEEIMARDDHE